MTYRVYADVILLQNLAADFLLLSVVKNCLRLPELPVWAVGRESSGSRVCVRNGVSSGSAGICRADAPKRHDERADGMDGIFHP